MCVIQTATDDTGPLLHFFGDRTLQLGVSLFSASKALQFYTGYGGNRSHFRKENKTSD